MVAPARAILGRHRAQAASALKYSADAETIRYSGGAVSDLKSKAGGGAPGASFLTRVAFHL